MRKIIILLFALLLMASCIAGRYDETKEAEYLDYVTDKIADKIVKREATEEARDSYIYYGEERYIDENGLARGISSEFLDIINKSNNGSGKIIYNSDGSYIDENGLAHRGDEPSIVSNTTSAQSNNDGSYIDENGLAHRGNSVSTWTVDNYNTKELKRTGNYLYVPYPDEDPYKDSPEYQVEYQNYLDEHDGID